MLPFLEKLVLEIIASSSDISDVKVVLPSQRAIVYFKHYLRKHVKKTSWLPKLYTIDQFVKQNSALETITSTELLLNFYPVYLKVNTKKEADPFDFFIKWAPSLLADFNEIDHYLCDAKVVFNDLKNIKEIDQWSFDTDKLTNIQENFHSFWTQIPVLYHAFKTELRREKKGYNGMIYEDVARNIFQVVDFHEPNSVYFAGFNALSNAEKQIIQTFVSSGKGQFIIDGDPYYIDDKNHEAGYFIRKNLQTEFLTSKTWIENHFKEQAKKIEVIASPSALIQAKLAGDILSKLPPEEINKTAVVLADEQLLLPVLNAIPNSIPTFNISMGYSLFYSPVGNLIQLIFALQQDLKKHSGVVYYKNFFALIDHYMLDLKSLTKQIKKECIQKNILFLSLKKIREMEALNGFSFLFDAWEDHIHEASKQCFYQLIQTLKKQRKIASSSLELEYLFAFEQLVNKLDHQLKEQNYIQDIATLKNLYFTLLKGENVSFVGEPLEGLQIIGMLETRSLDFERLIILSVNEDVLPKSEVSTSYIPYELKKLHGLPTYKEKESIYANHFYRLLQRASNVHLIYNNASGGIKTSEKSRYINQLTEELKTYNPSTILKERNILIPTTLASKENTTIPSSNEIRAKLNELNTSGFSPTALKVFINCPLDFYFKYVLRLKEEEEVDETIQANTLGTIIHQVLETLYKPLIGKILIEKDIQDLVQTFEPILQAEFEKEYSKDYQTGKNKLLYIAAKETITNYLNQEKALVSKNELIVKGLEQNFEKTIVTTLDGETKELKLRGTIDRIDSLNGKIRLIDYKTGSVDASKLTSKDLPSLVRKPDKEKAFQLLYYLLLVREYFPKQEIEAGIISFRAINKGLYTVNIENEPLNDLLTRFEEEVIELIQSIYSPSLVFEHNEKSTYCIYC